jgi:hypothetical protein
MAVMAEKKDERKDAVRRLKALIEKQGHLE